MKTEKYHLDSESSLTSFEFTSQGPKGAIRKRIEFQPTDAPDVYNLAFGDKNLATGEIDDLIVSDNGDTNKVLATVTESVYTFLDNHPYAFVYATGSTTARTRLYRMGIVRFYNQAKEDFYLYGQIGEDFVVFESGKEYKGFLVQRKFD
ncbi:MAG: hypothetical protein EOP45_19995 [Sphingobacteriaceae bacterium]|nr:MAG: hypothetical protein EOP45_19995 [Sphingobacteriaceae bacterium]